ncbi:hypothetical protein HanIR_Chr15g0759901 [Helianthus annuus]|nr:hypothetical protein HanIR_Chr15g0759901 [Helianthus annuus]
MAHTFLLSPQIFGFRRLSFLRITLLWRSSGSGCTSLLFRAYAQVRLLTYCKAQKLTYSSAQKQQANNIMIKKITSASSRLSSQIIIPRKNKIPHNAVIPKLLIRFFGNSSHLPTFSLKRNDIQRNNCEGREEKANSKKKERKQTGQALNLTFVAFHIHWLLFPIHSPVQTHASTNKGFLRESNRRNVFQILVPIFIGKSLNSLSGDILFSPKHHPHRDNPNFNEKELLFPVMKRLWGLQQDLFRRCLLHKRIESLRTVHLMENSKSRNRRFNMHCMAHKFKVTNPNHTNRVHLGDVKLVIIKNFKENFGCRQSEVTCREKVPK